MRRFLAGVIAVLIACGVAACGGDSNASKVKATKQDPKVFRTGKPAKEVGNVNWYTFYRPVLGLQAATYADYPEMMVTANLCESVVRVEPDYSIVPGLATFTSDKSYQHFTYKIRSGAKFWDGSPVTPDDVIFSIKANTTPPWGAGNAAIGNEIKSMSAVGEDTVRIALKHSDLTFNNQLAATAGKVYQKKQALAAGEKWGSPAGKVMCSGPYKLGKWDPANSLQIVRNDSYWGSDFKPLVKSITFSWPQEPNTVHNAFRTGSLDGGWNVPPSIVAPLQNDSAGQMYVGGDNTALQGFSLVITDMHKGALQDPTLRQAVSKAIDRDAIASKIYNGAADPLYSLLPAGAFIYEEERFKDAAAELGSGQDIDGAKQLIAETGKPAPKLVLALPAGDSLAQATAIAVQTDLKKAGIELKLKPMPPAQYAQVFIDPKARAGIDMEFAIYAPATRDPVGYFRDVMATGASINFNGYSNKQVDTLLARAQSAVDTDARTDAVLALQGQFVKDLPWIPLAAPRVTVWENERITGAPTSFTYLQSPWAALLGGK